MRVLHFSQAENAPTWAAYHEVERLLSLAGFSVGSMERGSPTAAMYGDYDISKWRNLSLRERREVHVTIEGSGGTFRNGPIIVTVRPSCPQDANEALSRIVSERRGDIEMEIAA